MKQVQNNLVLPKDTIKAKIHYEMFSNPDSVKEFENTEDFTQFDFNSFFEKNPKIQRTIVNEIQLLLNEERSRKALDLDEVPEKSKYVVDEREVYNIGMRRIFASLINGTEYDIDYQQKLLIEELAEVRSGVSYATKPRVMEIVKRVSFLDTHLSKYVEMFPRFTRGSLKAHIFASLNGIKDSLVKIFVRGTKDTSIYTLNEFVLRLRFDVEQARLSNFFHKQESENKRRSAYCLGIIGELEAIVLFLRESALKVNKEN